MTRNIIINPSFATGNSLMLDPITTWAQMPSIKGKFLYPIVHALTLLSKAGSKRADQLAKMFGVLDVVEAEKKMAEGSMVNVGSLYSKTTGEATELGDMMQGLGLSQKAVEFFTGKKKNPLGGGFPLQVVIAGVTVYNSLFVAIASGIKKCGKVAEPDLLITCRTESGAYFECVFALEELFITHVP